MSEIEHIRPTALANNPTYTHVVAARGERIVHISGQVSVDGDGDVVGVGDLAGQTEQVMINLGIALESAGASFDDVVKITTFVVNYTPEDRPTIAAVRAKYLSAENPPASTLLGVTALAAPEFLIEIEATAITD